MQLKRLSLTNFRAFQQADFDFKPGMNLVVGINGVGKSTVLDALRIMLSQTMPKFTASKSQRLPFTTEDITIGKAAFFVNLEFQAHGIDFSYDATKPREHYSLETRREIPEEEFSHQLRPEDRIRLRREKLTGYNEPERYELQPHEKDIPKKLKTGQRQPLAVYFSTRRSVPDGKAPTKTASAGGQAAAFAEALSERELRWLEFAEWWRVQQVLGQETGKARFGKNMETLSEAVVHFLDNIHDLRAVVEPKPKLLLDKGNITLDVNQLSDGERGMISLVLDLARRLALANPGISNPLSEGEAIVLIDELDLHLHPHWQRDIVQKLTSSFRKCQFIATTHSPQIVGEVPPENITILETGKAPYHPDQSLGMDTNWILEILMGTSSRNPEVTQSLNEISDLIEDGNYKQAQTKVNQLREQNLTRDPELVKLQARLDRFVILSEAKSKGE